MTNLYFPIFDKNFCARVDKKDKNLIRRPLLTREKPLEKIGERCRGFGKIHYEKMHFGQNKMKKTASRAKYNGERCRGFGKRHYAKMHCVQNTMKKNGFRVK